MRSTIMTTAAAICLLVGTVMAQDNPLTGGIGLGVQAQRDKGKKLEPPTLNLKSEETATWPMIATVLIVGACVLVAIIPPKRGHQD